VAITALRLNSPISDAMPGASLQRSRHKFRPRRARDKVEMKFGSELQTIQFMGRVNAFRPFGSADFHLAPNTVLEYRYASAVQP